MDEARTHPGLILGIGRFFHDPRGSVRGMLASDPTEARLLVYAMMAAAILLTGRIVTLLNDGLSPDMLAAMVTAQIVSLLFFLPLAYYGLAALGTVVARRFGGRGGWREGRAAFFWAALVSAPVLMLSMIGADLVSGAAGDVLGEVGGVFFAWAVAACFTEVFGFASTWRVLAVVCGPVLVLLGAVLLLRG